MFFRKVVFGFLDGKPCRIIRKSFKKVISKPETYNICKTYSMAARLQNIHRQAFGSNRSAFVGEVVLDIAKLAKQIQIWSQPDLLRNTSPYYCV